MEKAKELLLNGNNEKISEIAEQVGCGDNPQYFSQLFKKYAGMTPSAYLKHHAL
jgi:two-component system, response regulator YesN